MQTNRCKQTVTINKHFIRCDVTTLLNLLPPPSMQPIKFSSVSVGSSESFRCFKSNQFLVCSSTSITDAETGNLGRQLLIKKIALLFLSNHFNHFLASSQHLQGQEFTGHWNLKDIQAMVKKPLYYGSQVGLFFWALNCFIKINKSQF